MKERPSEGPFVALPQEEAAEVCTQLRDIWRQRNLTFDDYWNEHCDSSEGVDAQDVSGQVKQGVEGQEKVEPEDTKEEASVVVTRPENQAEGASLRQHHNVAGEGVEDKKVK